MGHTAQVDQEQLKHLVYQRLPDPYVASQCDHLAIGIRRAMDHVDLQQLQDST